MTTWNDTEDGETKTEPNSESEKPMNTSTADRSDEVSFNLGETPSSLATDSVRYSIIYEDEGS